MVRHFAVAMIVAFIAFGIPTLTIAQTWTPLVPNRAIYSLATNPKNSQVIYAGNVARMFLKSVDGGITWQDLEIGSFGGASQIMMMAVHPADTSIVFAGGQGLDGLVRSVDGGLSWTTVLTSDDGARLELGGSSALAFHPTAPDTVYAIRFNNGEVYRSINKGETWDSLSIPPALVGTDRMRAISVCPDSTHVMIVGGRRAYIYRSADGGRTWVAATVSYAVHPDLDIANFVWSPTIPGTVYATAQKSLWGNTTNAGLLRSTDYGNTWDRWRFSDTALYALHVRKTRQGDEIFLGGNQFDFPPDSGKIKGDSIVLRNLNGADAWQDLSDVPWMENEIGDIGKNVWAFALTERNGFPVMIMATDGGLLSTSQVTSIAAQTQSGEHSDLAVWSDGEDLFLRPSQSESETMMQYSIVDLLGRVVDRGQINASGTISIRGLDHGTFMVVCNSLIGTRSFLFQR